MTEAAYSTGELTFGPSKVGNDLFSVYQGSTVIATSVHEADAQLYAAAPDLVNAVNALLGLLVLITARDDVPFELKESLIKSHRVVEAHDALVKAGRRKPIVAEAADG